LINGDERYICRFTQVDQKKSHTFWFSSAEIHVIDIIDVIDRSLAQMRILTVPLLFSDRRTGGQQMGDLTVPTGAHSLDNDQLLWSLKPTVAPAMFDDSLCKDRPNRRQEDQFFDRRGIEIDTLRGGTLARSWRRELP
jgi:hypothetical protein